jgi:hypothetical protein
VRLSVDAAAQILGQTIVNDKLPAHDAVCLGISSSLEPTGFPESRICVWKLEMIDWNTPSSSGMGFSSAIFKCSSGRRMLINAVVSS